MFSVDKFPSVLELVGLSVSKIMLKTGKWKWNVGHGIFLKKNKKIKKKEEHMKGEDCMCMVSAEEIQENIS